MMASKLLAELTKGTSKVHETSQEAQLTSALILQNTNNHLILKNISSHKRRFGKCATNRVQ
jgi:hypothetical protein